MGWSQSKEENKDSHNAVAIATVQNLSSQVENKLNYVGIGLIIVGIVLLFALCYFIRNKCRNCANKWLTKSVSKLPPLTRIDVTPRAQAPVY